MLRPDASFRVKKSIKYNGGNPQPTDKTEPFVRLRRKRTESSVLLDRVRALQPMLRDAARDTETNWRVSEKTIDHLREAEVFKEVQPAGFGGFEYGLE